LLLLTFCFPPLLLPLKLTLLVSEPSPSDHPLQVAPHDGVDPGIVLVQSFGFEMTNLLQTSLSRQVASQESLDHHCGVLSDLNHDLLALALFLPNSCQLVGGLDLLYTVKNLVPNLLAVKPLPPPQLDLLSGLPHFNLFGLAHQNKFQLL